MSLSYLPGPDKEAGLYNYRARFYDPLPGSFTQPDSIVPNAMDPRAWNRFGYGYSNPVKFVDPSGHIPISPWDILDIGSFGLSLNDFISEPSLSNFGWLALDTVGLLPLFPALGTIRHAGKLTARGNDLTYVANRAKLIDEGISGLTGDITKTDIVGDLLTGTSQSKRIAQAIQKGDIGVNILSEEMFEKAFRYYNPKATIDPNDIDAFSFDEQIYLRRDNGIFIFRDTVHEGTHVLDVLSKKTPLLNRHLREKRAFFYEHFFQLAKGRPSNFDNLVELL